MFVAQLYGKYLPHKLIIKKGFCYKGYSHICITFYHHCSKHSFKNEISCFQHFWFCKLSLTETFYLTAISSERFYFSRLCFRVSKEMQRIYNFWKIFNILLFDHIYNNSISVFNFILSYPLKEKAIATQLLWKLFWRSYLTMQTGNYFFF